MPGTRAGGLKVRDINLARDPDYYRKIGRIGGKNGHTGGFASNPALAREAGKKGGAKSRRHKKYLYAEDGWAYYREKSGKTTRYWVGRREVKATVIEPKEPIAV